MTAKRAEKTKTGAKAKTTARTRKAKTTEPDAILLTREQFTGDPIADGAAEDAAHWLPVLRDEAEALEAAWRACCESGGAVDSDTLNKALVCVMAYPSHLAEIGMQHAPARTRRDVALAYDVTERRLRRALVILSRVATERGHDPAPVEAGGWALREAYKPDPTGNGTATGIDYPRDLWPEAMTGAEWERLPDEVRRGLRGLRDALARLNHASGETGKDESVGELMAEIRHYREETGAFIEKPEVRTEDQNFRVMVSRAPGDTITAKLLYVAHDAAARAEKGEPGGKGHYLTPRMVKELRGKLFAHGADRESVIRKYADEGLRRRWKRLKTDS
jgi:hypothetical protein